MYRKTILVQHRFPYERYWVWTYCDSLRAAFQRIVTMVNFLQSPEFGGHVEQQAVEAIRKQVNSLKILGGYN